MIIRKNLDPKIIIHRTWKRVALLLIVSSVVAVLHQFLNITHIAFSTVPASILGVAISFLVGFRVNSAYERWWEGRKLWGALINDSRTFARHCMTFISLKHYPMGNKEELKTLQKELIYRHIAFIYSLKCHLRKQSPFDEIAPFLSKEEFNLLQNKKHIPNALLEQQAERIRDVQEMGYLEDFRHMQMDVKLSSLCDAMGGCERIKNTVFPRQYSYYSTLFIKIYTFLIPFTLVEEVGYLVIPATVIIGFIFYALDTIASGIENPFENSINDIPMSSISRTIEINLKEQLGETDFPQPIEAIGGFLY